MKNKNGEINNRKNHASSPLGLRPDKLIAAGLAITMILGGYTTCTPAHALFGLFKKHHKDGDRTRKKREVAATEVGLIPGAPPALYWKCSDAPKAVALCLHELGLHKGVFDDLGKRLSKEQIAVYAIDLRGFGDWVEKGKEGRMDLDKTLQDVHDSVQIMHKLHPDLPVFLIGEAMGGALALEAASKYPDLIQGTISAAPGGEHFKTLANFTRVGSRLVGGGPNDDFEKMSNDLLELATPKPELREAFREDNSVRLDLTPRELMSCQFYMYSTKKMARNIKEMPVLIVHGEKDGESRQSGSKNVFEKLATKDKKYVLAPNSDHYAYEDISVNDDLMQTTITWINEHTQKSSEQPPG